MTYIRRFTPLVFLVAAFASIGWWSGYANLLFRYDSVSFSTGAGAEVCYTDARLWHDSKGQWCVEGRATDVPQMEGNEMSPRTSAQFPRHHAVVMRGARIAPGVGYIAVMMLAVAVFIALCRWANPPKEPSPASASPLPKLPTAPDSSLQPTDVPLTMSKESPLKHNGAIPRAQQELPALVVVVPPSQPDRFTSGHKEPPHYGDMSWAEIVELAKKREMAPQSFFDRLSLCSGIWFLWTGGFENPRPERPVDLNLRWQRLPDGRYILADFARLGFWDDGLESILARSMLDELIPLDTVACSDDPDADGLYHSSILRASWKNTFKPEEWLRFLDELDGKYYHSWFGSDVRGAREALERFGAIPNVPTSERPSTRPPAAVPAASNEQQATGIESATHAIGMEATYPISTDVLETFTNLRGLLDECGYSLSYERTNERRPEDHQSWKWAMWVKPYNHSRIEIMLDDIGGLNVWCFLWDKDGIVPKIKSASFSLFYAIPDTREITPSEIKQIELLIEQWQRLLCQNMDIPT